VTDNIRNEIVQAEQGTGPDQNLVRVSRDGRIGPSPVASRQELADSTKRLQQAAARPEPPRRFEVARRTDNELILFVTDRRESWIIYPPRSQYEFLDRPTATTVLVEHHPWAPYTPATMHQVEAATGCHEHGLACGANAAIQASVRGGWNPFT
jgi:hypothetical protein